MHGVNPTQIELFHLRLLLLRVKGAVNYNDLNTVNGIQHETFSDACLALGIIENDEEWRNSMKDGEFWMMPKQIRQLFVRLLIHCQLQHLENLWDEFKVSMSQDYACQFNINIENVSAENALTLGWVKYGKLNKKQKLIIDLILYTLKNPSNFREYNCFAFSKRKLGNGEIFRPPDFDDFLHF